MKTLTTFDIITFAAFLFVIAVLVAFFLLILKNLIVNNSTVHHYNYRAKNYRTNYNIREKTPAQQVVFHYNYRAKNYRTNHDYWTKNYKQDFSIREDSLNRFFETVTDNDQNDAPSILLGSIRRRKLLSKTSRMFSTFIVKSSDTCNCCGKLLDVDMAYCPSCGNERKKCLICFRNISYNDDIITCPTCQARFHLLHLKEALKYTDKCPVCRSSLSKFTEENSS